MAASALGRTARLECELHALELRAGSEKPKRSSDIGLELEIRRPGERAVVAKGSFVKLNEDSSLERPSIATAKFVLRRLPSGRDPGKDEWRRVGGSAVLKVMWRMGSRAPRVCSETVVLLSSLVDEDPTSGAQSVGIRDEWKAAVRASDPSAPPSWLAGGAASGAAPSIARVRVSAVLHLPFSPQLRKKTEAAVAVAAGTDEEADSEPSYGTDSFEIEEEEDGQKEPKKSTTASKKSTTTSKKSTVSDSPKSTSSLSSITSPKKTSSSAEPAPGTPPVQANDWEPLSAEEVKQLRDAAEAKQPLRGWSVPSVLRTSGVKTLDMSGTSIQKTIRSLNISTRDELTVDQLLQIAQKLAISKAKQSNETQAFNGNSSATNKDDVLKEEAKKDVLKEDTAKKDTLREEAKKDTLREEAKKDTLREEAKKDTEKEDSTKKDADGGFKEGDTVQVRFGRRWVEAEVLEHTGSGSEEKYRLRRLNSQSILRVAPDQVRPKDGEEKQPSSSSSSSSLSSSAKKQPKEDEEEEEKPFAVGAAVECDSTGRGRWLPASVVKLTPRVGPGSKWEVEVRFTGPGLRKGTTTRVPASRVRKPSPTSLPSMSLEPSKSKGPTFGKGSSTPTPSKTTSSSKTDPEKKTDPNQKTDSDPNPKKEDKDTSKKSSSFKFGGTAKTTDGEAEQKKSSKMEESSEGGGRPPKSEGKEANKEVSKESRGGRESRQSKDRSRSRSRRSASRSRRRRRERQSPSSPSSVSSFDSGDWTSDGSVSSGTRRLSRRLTRGGEAGDWRRKEGWAKRLGMQLLDRVEDVFATHAVRVRLPGTRSKQTTRALPVGRLGAVLRELGYAVDGSALANWRDEMGLLATDRLSVRETARALSDLVPSVSGRLGVEQHQKPSDQHQKVSEQHQKISSSFQGGSRTESLAPVVFPKWIASVRVAAGSLLAEAACASCGGSGAECEACGGSGLRGHSVEGVLRRLAAGRPPAQAARLRLVAASFASAAQGKTLPAKDRESALSGTAAPPSSLGRLAMSQVSTVLAGMGRAGSLARDLSAQEELAHRVGGVSDAAPTSEKSSPEKGWESGYVNFLEFLGSFGHVVEEAGGVMSLTAAIAALRAQTSTASAAACLDRVASLCEAAADCPGDARAWFVDGDDASLRSAVTGVAGGDGVLLASGWTPLQSSAGKWGWAVEGAFVAGEATPFPNLATAVLDRLRSSTEELNAAFENLRGAPRPAALARSVVQTAGIRTARSAFGALKTMISRALSNPHDQKAWYLRSENPKLSERVLSVGLPSNATPGAPATLGARLLECAGFVPVPTAPTAPAAFALVGAPPHLHPDVEQEGESEPFAFPRLPDETIALLWEQLGGISSALDDLNTAATMASTKHVFDTSLPHEEALRAAQDIAAGAWPGKSARAAALILADVQRTTSASTATNPTTTTTQKPNPSEKPSSKRPAAKPATQPPTKPPSRTASSITATKKGTTSQAKRTVSRGTDAALLSSIQMLLTGHASPATRSSSPPSSSPKKRTKRDHGGRPAPSSALQLAQTAQVRTAWSEWAGGGAVGAEDVARVASERMLSSARRREERAVDGSAPRWARQWITEGAVLSGAKAPAEGQFVEQLSLEEAASALRDTFVAPVAETPTEFDPQHSVEAVWGLVRLCNPPGVAAAVRRTLSRRSVDDMRDVDLDIVSAATCGPMLLEVVKRHPEEAVQVFKVRAWMAGEIEGAANVRMEPIESSPMAHIPDVRAAVHAVEHILDVSKFVQGGDDAESKGVNFTDSSPRAVIAKAWSQGMKTLDTVLSNVLSDPEADRFRRIRATSRAFLRRLGSLPLSESSSVSGSSMLISCGWREAEDGSLVLPPSASLPLLRARQIEARAAMEQADAVLASMHLLDLAPAEETVEQTKQKPTSSSSKTRPKSALTIKTSSIPSAKAPESKVPESPMSPPKVVRTELPSAAADVPAGSLVSMLRASDRAREEAEARAGALEAALVRAREEAAAARVAARAAAPKPSWPPPVPPSQRRAVDNPEAAETDLYDALAAAGTTATDGGGSTPASGAKSPKRATKASASASPKRRKGSKSPKRKRKGSAASKTAAPLVRTGPAGAPTSEPTHLLSAAPVGAREIVVADIVLPGLPPPIVVDEGAKKKKKGKKRRGRSKSPSRSRSRSRSKKAKKSGGETPRSGAPAPTAPPPPPVRLARGAWVLVGTEAAVLLDVKPIGDSVPPHPPAGWRLVLDRRLPQSLPVHTPVSALAPDVVTAKPALEEDVRRFVRELLLDSIVGRAADVGYIRRQSIEIEAATAQRLVPMPVPLVAAVAQDSGGQLHPNISTDAAAAIASATAARRAAVSMLGAIAPDGTRVSPLAPLVALAVERFQRSDPTRFHLTHQDTLVGLCRAARWTLEASDEPHAFPEARATLSAFLHQQQASMDDEDSKLEQEDESGGWMGFARRASVDGGVGEWSWIRACRREWGLIAMEDRSAVRFAAREWSDGDVDAFAEAWSAAVSAWKARGRLDVGGIVFTACAIADAGWDEVDPDVVTAVREMWREEDPNVVDEEVRMEKLLQAGWELAGHLARARVEKSTEDRRRGMDGAREWGRAGLANGAPRGPFLRRVLAGAYTTAFSEASGPLPSGVGLVNVLQRSSEGRALLEIPVPQRSPLTFAAEEESREDQSFVLGRVLESVREPMSWETLATWTEAPWKPLVAESGNGISMDDAETTLSAAGSGLCRALGSPRKEAVLDLALSPCGTWAVTVDASGTVKSWTLSEGDPMYADDDSTWEVASQWSVVRGHAARHPLAAVPKRLPLGSWATEWSWIAGVRLGPDGTSPLALSRSVNHSSPHDAPEPSPNLTLRSVADGSLLSTVRLRPPLASWWPSRRSPRPKALLWCTEELVAATLPDANEDGDRKQREEDEEEQEHLDGLIAVFSAETGDCVARARGRLPAVAEQEDRVRRIENGDSGLPLSNGRAAWSVLPGPPQSNTSFLVVADIEGDVVVYDLAAAQQAARDCGNSSLRRAAGDDDAGEEKSLNMAYRTSPIDLDVVAKVSLRDLVLRAGLEAVGPSPTVALHCVAVPVHRGPPMVWLEGPWGAILSDPSAVPVRLRPQSRGAPSDWASGCGSLEPVVKVCDAAEVAKGGTVRLSSWSKGSESFLRVRVPTAVMSGEDDPLLALPGGSDSKWIVTNGDVSVTFEERRFAVQLAQDPGLAGHGWTALLHATGAAGVWEEGDGVPDSFRDWDSSVLTLYKTRIPSWPSWAAYRAARAGIVVAPGIMAAAAVLCGSVEVRVRRQGAGGVEDREEVYRFASGQTPPLDLQEEGLRVEVVDRGSETASRVSLACAETEIASRSMNPGGVVREVVLSAEEVGALSPHARFAAAMHFAAWGRGTAVSAYLWNGENWSLRVLGRAWIDRPAAASRMLVDARSQSALSQQFHRAAARRVRTEGTRAETIASNRAQARKLRRIAIANGVRIGYAGQVAALRRLAEALTPPDGELRPDRLLSSANRLVRSSPRWSFFLAGPFPTSPASRTATWSWERALGVAASRALGRDWQRAIDASKRLTEDGGFRSAATSIAPRRGAAASEQLTKAVPDSSGATPALAQLRIWRRSRRIAQSLYELLPSGQSLNSATASSSSGVENAPPGLSGMLGDAAIPLSFALQGGPDAGRALADSCEAVVHAIRDGRTSDLARAGVFAAIGAAATTKACEPVVELAVMALEGAAKAEWQTAGSNAAAQAVGALACMAVGRPALPSDVRLPPARPPSVAAAAALGRLAELDPPAAVDAAEWLGVAEDEENVLIETRSRTSEDGEEGEKSLVSRLSRTATEQRIRRVFPAYVPSSGIVVVDRLSGVVATTSISGRSKWDGGVRDLAVFAGCVGRWSDGRGRTAEAETWWPKSREWMRAVGLAAEATRCAWSDVDSVRARGLAMISSLVTDAVAAETSEILQCLAEIGAGSLLSRALTSSDVHAASAAARAAGLVLDAGRQGGVPMLVPGALVDPLCDDASLAELARIVRVGASEASSSRARSSKSARGSSRRAAAAEASPSDARAAATELGAMALERALVLGRVPPAGWLASGAVEAGASLVAAAAAARAESGRDPKQWDRAARLACARFRTLSSGHRAAAAAGVQLLATACAADDATIAQTARRVTASYGVAFVCDPRARKIAMAGTGVADKDESSGASSYGRPSLREEADPTAVTVENAHSDSVWGRPDTSPDQISVMERAMAVLERTTATCLEDGTAETLRLRLPSELARPPLSEPLGTEASSSQTFGATGLSLPDTALSPLPENLIRAVRACRVLPRTLENYVSATIPLLVSSGAVSSDAVRELSNGDPGRAVEALWDATAVALAALANAETKSTVAAVAVHVPLAAFELVQRLAQTHNSRTSSSGGLAVSFALGRSGAVVLLETLRVAAWLPPEVVGAAAAALAVVLEVVPGVSGGVLRAASLGWRDAAAAAAAELRRAQRQGRSSAAAEWILPATLGRTALAERLCLAVVRANDPSIIVDGGWLAWAAGTGLEEEPEPGRRDPRALVLDDKAPPRAVLSANMAGDFPGRAEAVTALWRCARLVHALDPVHAAPIREEAHRCLVRHSTVARERRRLWQAGAVRLRTGALFALRAVAALGASDLLTAQGIPPPAASCGGATWEGPQSKAADRAWLRWGEDAKRSTAPPEIPTKLPQTTPASSSTPTQEPNHRESADRDQALSRRDYPQKQPSSHVRFEEPSSSSSSSSARDAASPTSPSSRPAQDDSRRGSSSRSSASPALDGACDVEMTLVGAAGSPPPGVDAVPVGDVVASLRDAGAAVVVGVTVHSSSPQWAGGRENCPGAARERNGCLVVHVRMPREAAERLWRLTRTGHFPSTASFTRRDRSDYQLVPTRLRVQGHRPLSLLPSSDREHPSKSSSSSSTSTTDHPKTPTRSSSSSTQPRALDALELLGDAVLPVKDAFDAAAASTNNCMPLPALAGALRSLGIPDALSARAAANESAAQRREARATGRPVTALTFARFVLVAAPLLESAGILQLLQGNVDPLPPTPSRREQNTNPPLPTKPSPEESKSPENTEKSSSNPAPSKSSTPEKSSSNPAPTKKTSPEQQDLSRTMEPSAPAEKEDPDDKEPAGGEDVDPGTSDKKAHVDLDPRKVARVHRAFSVHGRGHQGVPVSALGRALETLSISPPKDLEKVLAQLQPAEKRKGPIDAATFLKLVEKLN